MKLSRLPIAVAAASALSLAWTASALAATGEKTPLRLDEVETGRAATSPGAGGSLVRTLVGLAVVVAVIYGVYWILKQVKSSREERASGTGLTSIATLPLGPGRSLHMVRAGTEVVLVGVGEHGVTPIRTYGRHEAEAAGLLDQIADDSDADGWRAPGLDGLSPNANGGPPVASAGKAPAGTGATAAPGQQAFATPGEALRRGVDALRQRTVRR